MKILFIHPSMKPAGGIERVISIMANYWAANTNWEIYILTQETSSEAILSNSFFSLDSNIRIVGVWDKIAYTTSIHKWDIKKLRYVKIAYQKKIENIAPDVIISMMHGVDNLFLSDIVNPKIFIIGVNHLTLNYRHGDFEKGWLKRKCIQLSYHVLIRRLRKYDAVISLTLTDYLRLRKEKCKAFHIPNPNINIVLDSKDITREKRIISMGRLGALKGFERMIKIWGRIASKYPEWKLTIVGNGTELNALKKLATELKINHSVEFLPQTKEVYTILLQSSIFVLTSYTESFSMVIMEALSCGLPVVSYDCENGPRDLITNHYNGFLIPDGDEKSFAEKLEYLINNPDQLSRISQNAPKSIDWLNIEIIMQQWDDLLYNGTKK